MHRASIIIRFMLGALIGLGALGARAEAQAQTIHSFHGCRLENLHSDADSPVTNKSAGYGYAYCDIGGRLSRGSPSRLYIDVIDNHPSQRVSCHYFIRGFRGERLYAVTTYTQPSFTGHHFFLENLPEHLLGYLSMRCDLPPNVGQGESMLIGFSLQ